MAVSGAGTVAEARGETPSDIDLVASVRAGDDGAFEELYRRYHVRIRAYVHKRLRDTGRAEDVTQEAFLSALRRIRATDADIAFKPWLFEIARNAAIDVYRRDSRTEEVPVDDAALARQSDRGRLAGPVGPDIEVFAREQLELLSGAFAEMPETHHRALVMRELEGRSYREIGERLQLSNSAVESTLFRARRRLEHEYGELEDGRRCESARATAALLAEGVNPGIRRRRRFARHTGRCLACRRHAVDLGVATPSRLAGLRERAAALLPLPLFLRRRVVEASAEAAGPSSGALAGAGTQFGAGLMERAASLLAAAALAGAGGVAMHDFGHTEPPGKVGDGAAPPVSRPADPPRTRPKSDGADRRSRPERGTLTAPRSAPPRSRARPERRDSVAPKRQDRGAEAPKAPQAPSAPPPVAGDAGSSDGIGAQTLPGRLQTPPEPVARPVQQVTTEAGTALSQTTAGAESTLSETGEGAGAVLDAAGEATEATGAAANQLLTDVTAGTP